jgi:hypothetical protein
MNLQSSHLVTVPVTVPVSVSISAARLITLVTGVLVVFVCASDERARTALCMNAATYYSELSSWLLSHVNDTDMFLVQSVVTCGALFWYNLLSAGHFKNAILTSIGYSIEHGSLSGSRCQNSSASSVLKCQSLPRFRWLG